MKKNKYILIIIIILLNFSLVNAGSIENPKICLGSADEAGCLLNIAKNKALNITDINKQAKSISSILKTYADLNRSDFVAMERSFQILRNNKLELEYYLDLQISIATYFNKRDPKRSNFHIDKAVDLFYQAVERKNDKERVVILKWACGLIDENSYIWKNTSHVTAEYCDQKYTKFINKNDELDYDNILLTMFATWAQSDFIGLENSKKILDEKINSIEKYGIKNNKKLININAQFIKTFISAAQVDMYRRSGLNQQSEQALIQAKEALTELERLTNNIESIEPRLAVADVFNSKYDHKEAVATLKPIADIIHDDKKIKKIPLIIQVDYLIAMAKALDRSGFRTYSEMKLSNNEFLSRQSDVLYEKYIILNRLDEKNGTQSKQTFKALNIAAEAGNALAMHNLGVEYANGNGRTSKDLDKAAYWYSWAAVLGFAGAQNNLADLFEDAADTDSDMGISIYWYTQAALQGEPTAYLSLGELFLNGKGVPKNYVTASIWLSLAKQHLPDGINKNRAVELLNKSFQYLNERTRKYVQSRVYNFVPLRQTENKLSDKPLVGELEPAIH